MDSWNSIYTTTQLSFKTTTQYNNTDSGYINVTDGWTRNTANCTTDMIPILNGAAMIATTSQSDYTIGWITYYNIYYLSDYNTCCAVRGYAYNVDNLSVI